MNNAAEEISAPEHLTAAHDISAFECGVANLTEWLKNPRCRMRKPGPRALMLCVLLVGLSDISYLRAAVWRRRKRQAGFAATCPIHCQ